MRKPNRYSKQSAHNNFGVKNWFRNIKITNEETILECMAAYMIQFEPVPMNVKPVTLFNYVSDKFNDFTGFALKYLKENNYR